MGLCDSQMRIYSTDYEERRDSHKGRRPCKYPILCIVEISLCGTDLYFRHSSSPVRVRVGLYDQQIFSLNYCGGGRHIAAFSYGMVNTVTGRASRCACRAAYIPEAPLTHPSG